MDKIDKIEILDKYGCNFVNICPFETGPKPMDRADSGLSNGFGPDF